MKGKIARISTSRPLASYTAERSTGIGAHKEKYLIHRLWDHEIGLTLPSLMVRIPLSIES